MASSGKKGKKIKGKTFGLTEFLADSATGPGAVQTVIPRKSANWADDVENEDDFYDFSRKEKVILPTAPRATRSPEIDDEKVPKEPPFLAYISNLSYDVDTDDIAEFFRDLEITGIRLPRDNSQKTKGFGYVEFTNRKSLISALSMGDTTMKNRRVRIEVADSSDNDRRRGGMRDRGEMGRDRMDGPDRTMGDWRSGPRSDPVPDSDRDTGGFGRDRDGGYDRRGGGRREFGSGGFRDGDRGFRDSYDRDRGYDNRDGFGGRYGSDRDRDGYGERDRDRFGSRRGGDRDRERDFGGGGGSGGGSGSSSGGGRSGFGPPRRPYGSGPDYERGREDAPPERAEPRERPRLNLKPRTLQDEPAAAAAPAPAAQSSIFGGAKPVDTSAREKEIEERLAKEKGDLSRPPPRDNRSDDSRRDDHVRQMSSQSHDRSKSGSDYGDRDDEGPSDKPSAPPRVEPAPPPKENAWTRRSQQTLDAEPAEDNGRLSPHSDHDQEQRSTGRYQPPRPESPRRYRGEAGDTERRQPSNRGTGRKQFDGDSRGGREERGSRDERMSRDDRGSKDERISRDDRGSRDERVNRDERAGRDEKGARRGGAASTRGDRQRRPPTERDHRKEAGPQDELGRMPKYREQEVPNFAGSNKFAYLDDDELAEAD